MVHIGLKTEASDSFDIVRVEFLILC